MKQTTRKPPKKLRPKQQKYLRARIAGKSKTEAAKVAGYSPKNLAQSAYQAEKLMEEKVSDLYDRHGLTDDAIIENHLLPLLNAEETKFFAHNGRVVSTRRVKALGIRLPAVRLLAEMKGMLKKESENLGPNFKVVIINAEHRPPRPAVSVTIPTLDQEKK
jgi:hypothetical protein